MTAMGAANTALNLFSSAKSIFGGGEDGGTTNKEYAKQIIWNNQAAREYPTAQVEGLRRAGLNPMLAVGKGISGAPALVSEPGLEGKLATAKQQANAQTSLVAAQASNLQSASAKNVADAALAEEQAKTEEARRLQMGAETAHTNVQAGLDAMRTMSTEQQWHTEGFQTKIKELEHSLLAETYGERRATIQQQLDNLRQEGRSLKTKADVDALLLKYERLAGMANQATGAVSNLIPWSRFFRSSAKDVAAGAPAEITRGGRTASGTITTIRKHSKK